VQPFRGLNAGTYSDSGAELLELIDGGSNLENIPLGPLFVKSRELDVILAVDASADQNTWPKCV
jgi:lysophospholipase